MHPEEIPTTSLRPGQVGYIACNMKESSEGTCYGYDIMICRLYQLFLLAHIGDTLYRVGEPVEPMPGFQPAKAMVCTSAYSYYSYFSSL